MRSISKYFLAGAVAVGLGAFAAAQPAQAAIATYDLAFSTPASVSATGSISLDTALLGGNSSCGFGNGCGFTAFSVVFNVGGSHFTFGPADLDPLILTMGGGVPSTLLLGEINPVSSAEDINDVAGLHMNDSGWSMNGVIDEFEFNISGTYAFAAPGGGGEPDPTGVPEPGTLALFGAGLVGVALTRRKRARVA
jgi:hypothetical protein